MKTIYCIFLFIPLLGFSQRKDLDKYLYALQKKSAKIIADYSFTTQPPPSIDSVANVVDSSFITDAGVRGYIAHFRCKSTQSNTATYMAVMFLDKLDRKWKVYSIRTAVDVRASEAAFQRDVDAGKFYTSKQNVYKNLSYWQMMCGKIKEAKQTSLLAENSAKENKDNNFSNDDLRIIGRIK